MGALQNKPRPAQLAWLLRIASVGALAGAAWVAGTQAIWQAPTSADTSPQLAAPMAQAVTEPRKGRQAAVAGSFWQSEAERDRRWLLGVAEDLQDAIRNFDGVVEALVLIDPGEAHGFKRPEPRAVVQIRPASGNVVGAALVDSVQQLVSGAVAGLQPARVTVIDLRSGQVVRVPSPSDAAAAARLDAAIARQAASFRRTLREAVAHLADAEVDVWPTAAAAPAMAARLNSDGSDQPDRAAFDSRGNDGDVRSDARLASAKQSVGEMRLAAFADAFSARIVVPADEVARLFEGAADSDEAWRRACSQLAADIRTRAREAEPTLLPDAVTVEIAGDRPVFEPGGPDLKTWMAVLVVSGVLAGLSWGRPIATTPARSAAHAASHSGGTTHGTGARV